MGKRGPAPRPTVLKALQGERRTSRINRNEPVPPEMSSDAPDYLDANASAEWDRLAPALRSMGLLTGMDTNALAAYCTAVVHHRRAVELVNAANVLIASQPQAGRPVLQRHPAMMLVRDQATLMLQLGARFGLTPSDRSQLGIMGAPGGKKDAGAGPERLFSGTA